MNPETERLVDSQPRSTSIDQCGGVTAGTIEAESVAGGDIYNIKIEPNREKENFSEKEIALEKELATSVKLVNT